MLVRKAALRKRQSYRNKIREGGGNDNGGGEFRRYLLLPMHAPTRLADTYRGRLSAEYEMHGR